MAVTALIQLIGEGKCRSFHFSNVYINEYHTQCKGKSTIKYRPSIGRVYKYDNLRNVYNIEAFQVNKIKNYFDQTSKRKGGLTS